MRSLLTMLGIIVGVSTVMITLGIGAGAREAISSQISSLGSNLIVLNSGPPPGTNVQPVYLYLSDARAILENCPSVAEVAPQQETRMPMSYGSAQLSSSFVMGITASYARVRRADLAEGRFLDEQDDETAAKVAVIGSSVRDYLVGKAEPLERRILINGVDFEVIGVLEARGDSPGLGPGMSTDDRTFIPLSALQKRLIGTEDLRLIGITARDPEHIPDAATEVRDLMNRRHPHNPFEIKTQLELMQTSNSVSEIVTVLLTSLAAVSLIVGGIGIMNIMLVSVTERTREIGVQRAVGATRRDILSQFLLESIVLSLAGGLIGVALGIVVSLLARSLLEWPIPVVPTGAVLALGASTLVGLLSGVYPARRASQLKVVDALRFE